MKLPATSERTTLQRWLEQDDPRLSALADRLWQWAVEILDGHRNPFFTNYMAIDHGPDHLSRVMGYLDELAACYKGDLRNELGASGLFYLLSATALHDIGMYFGFHLLECKQEDLRHRKAYSDAPSLLRFLPCEIQHGSMKRFLRKAHEQIAAHAIQALAPDHLLDLTEREERLLRGGLGKTLSYIVRTYTDFETVSDNEPFCVEIRENVSDQKMKIIKAMLTMADFMHLDYTRTSETSIRLIIFYIRYIEETSPTGRLDSRDMEYVFREEFGLDPVDFVKHFFNYYIHSVTLHDNAVVIASRVPPDLPKATREGILTRYRAKMAPGIEGNAVTALQGAGFNINYNPDLNTRKETSEDLALMPYWLVTYLFAYIHNCAPSDPDHWHLPLSVIFLLAYEGLAREPAVTEDFFARCQKAHDADTAKDPWDVVVEVLGRMRAETEPQFGDVQSSDQEALRVLHDELRGFLFQEGITETSFLALLRLNERNNNFSNGKDRKALRRLEESGCVVRRGDRLLLKEDVGARLALVHMNEKTVYPLRLRTR